MKYITDFATRCKASSGVDTHNRIHAVHNDSTLCGKELDSMWNIEPATVTIDDVSCIICKSVIKRKGYT